MNYKRDLVIRVLVPATEIVSTETQTRAASIPPLLKWPGGKRNLLRFILPLLPKEFKRYYETFLGGGALFFALQPRRTFLSDKNDDLISAYKQIRDDPKRVIGHLKQFRNTEEDYYLIRSSVPRSEPKRAARQIGRAHV